MAMLASSAAVFILLCLVGSLSEVSAREDSQQRQISGWILQLETPPSNVSELLNCSQSLCGPEPRGYVPDQHTSRRNCASFCFADLFCRQYLLVASTSTDEEDEVRGKCVLLPIVCEIAGTVGCAKDSKAFVVSHLPMGYALITEEKLACDQAKSTRPDSQAVAGFQFRSFDCAPALSSDDKIVFTNSHSVYLEDTRASKGIWEFIAIKRYPLFEPYLNERGTFETVLEMSNRAPRAAKPESRRIDWTAAMLGNGSLFVSEEGVPAGAAPVVFYSRNGSQVELQSDENTKHSSHRFCHLVPVPGIEAEVYLVCKIQGEPCQRQILVVRNARLRPLASTATVAVCEVQTDCPISGQFATLREITCAEPQTRPLGHPVAAYAKGRILVAPQPFIAGDLPAKLPRENESNRRWILEAKCATICWRRIVYQIMDPENPKSPAVTVTKEFGEQDVGFLSFLFRHHRSIVADEYGNVLVSMLVATNYDPFSGQFFVQTELYLFDQYGRYVENLTKFYENYVPFSVPIEPMSNEEKHHDWSGGTTYDVLSSLSLPEPSRIEMHKLWVDEGKALLWTAEINAENALDWRLQIIKYMDVAKK